MPYFAMILVLRDATRMAMVVVMMLMVVIAKFGILATARRTMGRRRYGGSGQRVMSNC